MALGDGIRRNIAHVDPAERALLRDAIIELNHRYFPGSPGDTPPGGVSWWFKQDEIHQATHVHGGPEFLPWHREITNRFEAMLREINPQLSLHYWDFKEDPRAIPNANLGGGNTGTLDLFDVSLMGSPGAPDDGSHAVGPIGEPWLTAGFYDPQAGTTGHPQAREVSGQPTDPPQFVYRPSKYPGPPPTPLITPQEESNILGLQPWGPAVPTNHQGDPAYEALKPNYFRTAWEDVHNQAHPYFANISPHDAFRDPFVFLLHSNVDRIFAIWQCDPAHPERLDPNTVYGAEGNLDVDVFAVGVASSQNLSHQVEPWSTGHGEYHDIRPWEPTHENQGFPHTYHDLSVVTPPCYDNTMPTTVRIVAAENPGNVINFNDVPQGETALRAAVFEIYACGDVTLQVKAGSGPNAPYSVANPPGGTAFAPHGTDRHRIARLWFQFTGTAPGAAPSSPVTIHCVETNQDFVLTLHGNSIARPTVAVMLTLDQSGSMGWLAGVNGTTKRIDVLHQAAANFCQLVQASNGVGMVSFDQAAYPGVAVSTFTGAANDPNLTATVQAISNLQPQGATSIGNGIALGRNTLNPVAGFDKKAMIVFTDGLENTSLFIADVMGSLDAQTFAIGLGTAEQVSANALNAITSHTGGYLLLSGPLSPAIDDQFRLQKYFLQVLAGVSNTSIVTDPSGVIYPGGTVRIPFRLCETDIDATAILLADHPGVTFDIETPAGDVMTPGAAAGLGATYAVGTNMSYYRYTLPLALGANPAQEGTWYAVLQYRRKRGGQGDRAAAAAPGGAIRYSFSAHAFTNLRMQARVSQNSLEPGATLTITATLTEYGVPVAGRATVLAEIERPDGSSFTLALPEVGDGRFQASTAAALAGVYRIRVMAAGVTMRGMPFTREQLLSAAAVLGGDNPPPQTGPGTKDHDEELCRLIECLLGPRSLGEFLMKNGVEPKAVLACVETWCKTRLAGPSAQELAEREGTIAPPN
jgi:hypothetical protein